MADTTKPGFGEFGENLTKFVETWFTFSPSSLEHGPSDARLL